jgi:NAD(P)-dependent dehydrogenase (short-subunit alcohol dehydrogenase family)
MADEAHAGSLAGQVAVVTGTAAGIGAGIARAFGEAGARVATCDIQAKGADVANAISHDTGAEVTFVQADVREADQVKAFVDGAAAHFGGIDILVANAGIWRPTDPVGDDWETTVESFDLLVGTNLRGLYLTGRAAIPHLVSRGGGHIVNIATDHICPPPGWALGGGTRMDAYDASKFGVTGLTESWSKRLAGEGVRVNALCMDAVDSEMTRYATGKALTDEVIARWMTPADIAGLLLDLIHEGPDGRTGENIGIWLDHDIVLPPRREQLPSRHR